LDIERVQPAVVDPGAQKLGDRPKPDAGLEVNSEAARDPGDVLLVVYRHDADGPATLGQEGVEPVERAHVEHARAAEVLRYRAQAVAVIPRDARRVHAGAVERERVEPQRHAPQRGARLLPPGVDRQEVRDRPLRGGGLGDGFQILGHRSHLLRSEKPESRTIAPPDRPSPTGSPRAANRLPATHATANALRLATPPLEPIEPHPSCGHVPATRYRRRPEPTSRASLVTRASALPEHASAAPSAQRAPAWDEQRERVQAAGCTAPEPRRHERAVTSAPSRARRHERAVTSRDDLLTSSSEMLERLMDVHTKTLGLARDDHDDLDVLIGLAHGLPPGSSPYREQTPAVPARETDRTRCPAGDAGPRRP